MARILIIDDDDNVRGMLKAMLCEMGHTCFEADGGETGCETARSELPDLIICDIMMDGMDGLSMLTQMRGEPATSAIPFILITGGEDHMREGMDLGADDYLAKPFTLKQLRSAIDARFRKHEAIRR